MSTLRIEDGSEIFTKVSGLRRRQFLKGLGGTAVALPFMRSLLPRDAAAHGFLPQPRFVALMTDHGGVWPEHTYPDPSTATNATQLLPGWNVHWGPLTLEDAGGGLVQVSPFVRAEASVLTPSIVSKLNLVRGLDLMFWMGHGMGRALGNFVDSDYDADYPVDSLTARPTIDQVMAWSESFYSDLTAVTLRSIHLGQDWAGNISYGWSNPAAQSGEIITMPTIESSLALFQQVFPSAGEDDERPLVVDRVMESYAQLRSGAFGNAARLSAADRQRLDDHMDRLLELERKLEAASCSGVIAPTQDAVDAATRAESWALFNDVLVTAFICGTSRIATVHPMDHWHDGVGSIDWHQEVAHRADEPGNLETQLMLVESHRNWFRHVLLDLAVKLDVEEADGRTFLDNSLLMYTTEAGTRTHNPEDIAVVTIGGAAGWMNTGRFLDYRNRADTSRALEDDFLTLRPGVSYNQWLGNVLLAMGLPRDEWERAGEKGYGGNTWGFDDPVMQLASDPLPFLAI